MVSNTRYILIIHFCVSDVNSTPASLLPIEFPLSIMYHTNHLYDIVFHLTTYGVENVDEYWEKKLAKHHLKEGALLDFDFISVLSFLTSKLKEKPEQTHKVLLLLKKEGALNIDKNLTKALDEIKDPFFIQIRLFLFYPHSLLLCSVEDFWKKQVQLFCNQKMGNIFLPRFSQ